MELEEQELAEMDDMLDAGGFDEMDDNDGFGGGGTHETFSVQGYH